jgi:hypothetical protein
MRQAIAGGVTTVLYIPGSGTNIGGQGVLVKSAFDKYEENLVRDPGSLKIAQWGNPESWGPAWAWPSRTGTRAACCRRASPMQALAGLRRKKGPEPRRNIELDVFRDLLAKQIAISVHTQVYQVVLMTITMIAEELHLPVFTDHSEVGGWLAAPEAVEGRRALDRRSAHIDHVYARGFIRWARNKHEGVRGWRPAGRSSARRTSASTPTRRSCPRKSSRSRRRWACATGSTDSGLRRCAA